MICFFIVANLVVFKKKMQFWGGKMIKNNKKPSKYHGKRAKAR